MAIPLPGVGSIIDGKYRVVRVIGAGGMGGVFEVVNERLGQAVAIKILLPDLLRSPNLVSRFEREARAAALLRHRHFARVFDVHTTESGLPFMVMELLHGRDLARELEADGRLTVGAATHYVVQACAAMEEAHAMGIVHRDLKPSNLFLNKETDGTTCLKILDFGISKVVSDDSRLTATEAQMGTPLYMSPEQLRSAKNVDFRTDIWSLGVILYELLSGTPPFTGSTSAAVGAAIATEDPESLRAKHPEIPEALDAIVLRAMAKDPAKRFDSVASFRKALEPFAVTPSPTIVSVRPAGSEAPDRSLRSFALTGTVAKGTDGNWTASDAPPPRKRAWLRTLVIGAVAGVIGVGVMAVRSLTPPATNRSVLATTSNVPPLEASVAPAPAPPSAVSEIMDAAPASPATASAGVPAKAPARPPPKSAPRARPAPSEISPPPAPLSNPTHL